MIVPAIILGQRILKLREAGAPTFSVHLDHPLGLVLHDHLAVEAEPDEPA